MDDLRSRIEQLTPLQRATLAIKELRGKLDAYERARAEPIAIVGIGCRFPGGDGPDETDRIGPDCVHPARNARALVDDPGKRHQRGKSQSNAGHGLEIRQKHPSPALFSVDTATVCTGFAIGSKIGASAR